MAHGVEDGGVQDVAGDGVVEGVTAHFVGGFQHGGGHALSDADRTLRQEGAQHLGTQVHVAFAHAAQVAVVVDTLGVDDQGEQGRQGPAAVQGGPVEGFGDHVQHTHAVGAAHERQPQFQSALPLDQAHGLEAVGLPGQGGVHVQFGAAQQGNEDALLQVDEVHCDPGQPQHVGITVGQFQGLDRPVGVCDPDQVLEDPLALTQGNTLRHLITPMKSHTARCEHADTHVACPRGPYGCAASRGAEVSEEPESQE